MTMASLPSRFRVTAAALALVLLVAGTACNEPKSGPAGSTDSSGNAGTERASRRTDSAKGAAATPLEQAPADLAADSLPIVAPDGGQVRYGIRSGRIEQQYLGHERGTRTLLFDKYGMMERREENVVPFPEWKKGVFHNMVTIVTPEEQSYLDLRSRKGLKKPNESLQRYIDAGAGKTTSLGELVIAGSGGERLPDTTIAGYHCRVLRKTVKGMVITNWLWRGIVIQEHVVIPKDTLEYAVVTTKIVPNIEVPDTSFRFDPSYPIEPYKPRKQN